MRTALLLRGRLASSRPVTRPSMRRLRCKAWVCERCPKKKVNQRSTWEPHMLDPNGSCSLAFDSTSSLPCPRPATMRSIAVSAAVALLLAVCVRAGDASDGASDVVVLTDSSIGAALTANSDKGVLLEFYAPWYAPRAGDGLVLLLCLLWCCVEALAPPGGCWT